MQENNRIRIALILIFTCSFFLRIYKLEQYPLQINQDELSNIYDGYSIAETGADRWGTKYPVIVRGFGEYDYRPALYSWMGAASIKAFGYSVFSGRLPAALLGCLSLILLYLVSKKIGGTLFALFALLLAGLSPWHLQFSRMSHEGAILPPFFLILVLYLWFKAKEKQYAYKWLIFLGLATGLGANAYHATRLVFFLLALFLVTELFMQSRFNLKKVFTLILFMLIGAAPQIIALLFYTEHFFSRASGTTMEFSFSPDYFEALLKNIFSNLSPVYLFFSFGGYNNLTVARLLTVEFLFFYLGLFFFYKIIKAGQPFRAAYLYLLLFIAIIPGALTTDNPHALRTSGLVILLPMVSAAGIIFLSEKIKNISAWKISLTVITVLIIFNYIYFHNQYMRNLKAHNPAQQNYLVQVCNKLNTYKDNYSRIYFEEMGNQIYIYVVNYCHMSPGEFQQSVKLLDGNGGHVARLGKYFFLDRDVIEKEVKNYAQPCLLVISAPDSNYTLVDKIDTDDGEKFFYSNVPLSAEMPEQRK